MKSPCLGGIPGASAGLAGQHPEEALDIGVSSGIAVAIEVGGNAGGRAVAGEAGKKGFDVGVGAVVPVAIEVGCARPGGAGGAVLEHHAVTPLRRVVAGAAGDDHVAD